MTKKVKILFSSEYSGIRSGFSNYNCEILKKLNKLDNVEVREHGAYCRISDLLKNKPEWLIYANTPEKGSKEEEIYKRDHLNQFGKWRWERVLLDYKPDIVFCCRDLFMCPFIFTSPLRKYYNLWFMSPSDSSPQKESWLYFMQTADRVYSYSEWGKNILEREGGGLIPIIRNLGGGINEEIYKPVLNKAQHKKKFGLDPDSYICLMVFRNQKRKLFDNLCRSFRIYLDKCDDNLRKRSKLLIHTSYPDSAWHIPDLIKKYKLASYLLVTYYCKLCNNIFISPFQDAKAPCQFCKNSSAIFSNVLASASRLQLAEIYNLADLYIQHISSGGLELPLIEAAACGLPIVGTKVAALNSVIEELEGEFIEVEKWYLDCEMQAYRAFGDDKQCANLMLKWAKLPSDIRSAHGFKSRQKAIEYYSWDNIAKKWIEEIQTFEKKDLWNQPINLINPPQQIPQNLSNVDFAKWYIHCLQDPTLNNSFKETTILHALNWGAQNAGPGQTKEFDRKKLVEQLQAEINNNNTAELARCGQTQLQIPDYIKLVHGQTQNN